MGCVQSNASGAASLKSKYKMGAQVGEGAYSKVFVATSNETGQKVAVKVVNKQPDKPKQDENLRKEVEILQQLKHPNIVNCLDFFEDKKCFHVVMEFLQGGEVFDKLVQKQHYSELEARELVLVLLNAIKYCHDRSIVHRDLKCENLLLVSKESNHLGSIKVADFGFATRVHGLEKLPQCGTPGYVAPEILKREPYGLPCDMWSIGVISYILLGGYPPFNEKTQPKLFQKIKSGKYVFDADYWKNVSMEAQDFIAKLLVVDQKKRSTVDQAMKHEWILRAESELANRKLDSNLKALRRYNARRKIMAAARTVIAANRFKNMFKAKESETSTPTST